MKFLFDLFPVLLFFGAYKLSGIYAATAVLIVASLAQVCITRLRHGRCETSHLVTLALVVVFGGATLLLQDEMFIKWKPTVINWLFAAAFLGSRFFGEKSLIERMMGSKLTLPAAVWGRLNAAWTFFFIAMGTANLFVIYSFDTATWVDFKLFGMMGMTFAFVILQSIYLARYMQFEQPESD
jgi:intracellular septation protein